MDVTDTCHLRIHMVDSSHGIRCEVHDYEITQFAFMDLWFPKNSDERCVLDTRSRGWKNPVQ